MNRGTDAAVDLTVDQLYRCPPRCGEGGANMQCTAIYIHRAVTGQKVLELISRDLSSAQSVCQCDVDLWELGSLDVQDASAAMLMVSPEPEMTNKLVFIPRLGTIKNAMICRVLFPTRGAGGRGDKAPFGKCASARVLVFHIGEKLLLSLESERSLAAGGV
jgi:hypothetical protein